MFLNPCFLIKYANAYFNTMERVTFSIPADLKKNLARYPDINWPMVVKKAIAERLDYLEKFENRSKHALQLR